jgi:hypothetical protein
LFWDCAIDKYQITQAYGLITDTLQKKSFKMSESGLL